MPSSPDIARKRWTSKYRKARAIVLERDAGICHICNEPGADTADHLVPLSKGGDANSPLNMRAAHRGCNSRRGDRPLTGPDLATSRAW